MVRLAICIATCQRLRSLDRLLESLTHLRFDKSPEPEIKVIVVDNDGGGSARPVTERWVDKLPWALVYEIESRRGIPFARNRLVNLAQDCDFLAFIDDDEVASPNWLDELIWVQKRCQADVVAGPVLPRFEFTPAQWIVRGGFFDRQRHETGDSVKNVGTGNVLVTCKLLSQLEGPFEESLALQGGSDTLLFWQLQQLGARSVWADDALVEESVPKSRATLKWLLQRAYRGGNTFSICCRRLFPTRSWIYIRALKGIGRIGQGTIMLLPSILISRIAFIRAVRLIFLGAGTISGIFGKEYQEYQSIHAE